MLNINHYESFPSMHNGHSTAFNQLMRTLSDAQPSMYRLVCQHLPPALFAEFAAALLLCIGLQEAMPRPWLTAWFGAVLASIGLRYLFMRLPDSHAPLTFKKRLLFILLVAGSGILWGIAGSVLIPAESMPLQVFVAFMLTGVTTAAIAIYSPVMLLYAVFLVTAFLPFTLWLFSQGDFYTIIGFASIVYMLLMGTVCMLFHRLVKESMSLRSNNLNLASVNQLLEEEVSHRTEALNASLAITRSVLESTGEAMLVSNHNGQIDFCNHQFMDMWEIPAARLVEQSAEQVLNEIATQLKEPGKLLECIQRNKENHDWVYVEDVQMPNGKCLRITSRPRRIDNKNMGRIWIFEDITLQKGMEQQLIYQASHDLLTQLPNRAILYDRMEQAIRFAHRTQSIMGILFLDLDKFKLINDKFGHDVGDLLLVEVASRVKNCLRECDTVSRFGGDEFVILFTANQFDDFKLMAERILSVTEDCRSVLPAGAEISASIGISLYPEDGNDAETLLKHADIAMYRAKEQGRHGFVFYHETLDSNPLTNASIAELQQGIEKQEFFLLYQPIISLSSGRIMGAEALVRWRHPKRGVLLPESFIPDAEERGLMVPLGGWILREACQQAKTWQDAGLSIAHMAVNISATQFHHRQFVELISKVLAETKLPRGTLEVEISENVVIQQQDGSLDIVRALQAAGVRVSVDHFGHGYSGLNNLKTFRVDKLKIDRSFIHDCLNQKSDASIVEALVTLSRGLDLTVSAEGVETVEQHRFLETLHCDELQGYLYGKPMTKEDFENVVRHQKMFFRPGFIDNNDNKWMM
ncbi:EAL domain-containing protein [Legionella geestiana]|nr:EAL domain-containing protein [Legionella geestiana]